MKWALIGLAAAGAGSTGVETYEANGLDISAQPPGTSMKWRVQTVYGSWLAVEIHAVVLKWA